MKNNLSLNCGETIEHTASPKRRTGLLIWLIVSQLLAVGSLLIWLVVAGLSVMAFDQGQSDEAWAFVIVVWSYPVFPILMGISSWVAFAYRKNRLAAGLTGMSFVIPVLLYVFVWASSLIGP